MGYSFDGTTDRIELSKLVCRHGQALIGVSEAWPQATSKCIWPQPTSRKMKCKYNKPYLYSTLSVSM
jgi:hypothetical protein